MNVLILPGLKYLLMNYYAHVRVEQSRNIKVKKLSQNNSNNMDE